MKTKRIVVNLIQNLGNIFFVFLLPFILLMHLNSNGVIAFRQILNNYYIFGVFVIFTIFNIWLNNIYSIFDSELKSKARSKNVLLLFLINFIVYLLIYLFINFNSISIVNLILYLSYIIIVFSLQYFYNILFGKLFERVLQKKVIIIGDRSSAISLCENVLYENEKNVSIDSIYFDEKFDLNIFKESIYQIKAPIEIFMSTEISFATKQMVYDIVNNNVNIELYYVPTTADICFQNTLYKSVDDFVILSVKKLRLNAFQKVLKRLFDVLISFILIIISSPIIILISILVWKEDKGPSIYKQKRHGKDLKYFTMYKFRSMRVKQTESELNTQAKVGDSRITKIGKFIRATRLDELPQLFNVLKGDMSLVGPRPLMDNDEFMALKLDAEFNYRYNVKPGITGLQQIRTRHNTSWSERTKYDLLYLQDYSFIFDIKILLYTFQIIFNRDSGLGIDKHLTLEEISKKYNFVLKSNDHKISFEKQE